MIKSLLLRLRKLASPKTMMGIVERTESLTAEDLKRTILRQPYYEPDDFGNYPQKVFFRNYFGDLVCEHAPKGPVSGDMMDFRKKYQKYKPGDKFP